MMAMKQLLAVGACLALGAAAEGLPIVQGNVVPKLGFPAAETNSPFRIFSIVSYRPGNEDELARRLIDLHDRTGITEMLYCLYGMTEEGAAEKAVASFRALKRGVDGSGIRLGVLLQSTIGHYQVLEGTEKHPWTRLVNLNGEVERYCTLDPGFRAFWFGFVSALAKEKACFFLTDDDLRAYHFNIECFCPLHTAEFNRRTGSSFTPEQFRAAVKASKPGDPVYEAFDRLQQDTLLAFGALIRSAIDSVDPSIPAGSCLPGAACVRGGNVAKVIAGAHPTVLRVANCLRPGYQSEGSLKTLLPANLISTQALEQHWRGIDYLLVEGDTYPHSLWAASSRGMHALLVAGIFSGLKGAKLWHVNTYMKPGDYPVARNYTDILAANRRLYPALAEAVCGTELEGLVIPCRIRTGRDNIHAAEEHYWPGPDGWGLPDWGNCACGRLGVPFRAAFAYDLNLTYGLAGTEIVRRLTDAELRQLLTRNLLLDPGAAGELATRGFGDRIGGKGAVPGSRFTQPNGARVLISHETLTADPLAYTQEGRAKKDRLLAALDWLAGSPIPYAVMNEQDIALQQRKCPDGSRLLAVFNLNADPLETLDIRCAKLPAKVRVLGTDGLWKETPFQTKGNVISLRHPLDYTESVFIKLADK